MIRSILVAFVLALTAGCGTMPPSNPNTNDSLLLAKANDGSTSIIAKTFAYQYDDEAALCWVTLFVTQKGLYAAHWDQFTGAYGLSLRLKNSDIKSVTNKPVVPHSLAVGTMLVVTHVDGYEFGFVGEKPGEEVEQALKRNLVSEK